MYKRQALALELASRHITVNAVAPGIISTSATQETFGAEAIERLVPMKRAGTVEEVAGLVSFLVSDLSLITISEPTRPYLISYAVFFLQKKKKNSTLPASSRP